MIGLAIGPFAGLTFALDLVLPASPSGLLSILNPLIGALWLLMIPGVLILPPICGGRRTRLLMPQASDGRVLMGAFSFFIYAIALCLLCTIGFAWVLNKLI
jgi:hypothetical protein